jgi:hypothetical protein
VFPQAATSTTCSVAATGGIGGVPAGNVQGGMSMQVSDAYAAALTDSVPGALDDCFITPGEAALGESCRHFARQRGRDATASVE